MTEYVLTTDSLTKYFGGKKAVSEVNMHVPKGSVYGLIGENGAGKTTIMRMIVGLAAPSKGNIKLFESNNLNAGRKRIGCVIENPAIYGNMTAKENLETFRRMVGDDRENVIEDILKTVGLSETGKKKVKNFSLGMKQRLSIGIALLGDPELLILDEPINGLDPTGIIEVRDLVMKLCHEQGKSIIISSHILEELSKIATSYGVISSGVLVDEFTSEELQKKCSQSIKIVVDDVQMTQKVLSEKFTSNYNIIDGNTFIVNYDINATGAINTELIKNNVVVSNISLHGLDLENYFIELMRGGLK